jgi:hypothetical protein
VTDTDDQTAVNYATDRWPDLMSGKFGHESRAVAIQHARDHVAGRCHCQPIPRDLIHPDDQQEA